MKKQYNSYDKKCEHNMLGFTKGGKEQSFYRDGNVAAMEDPGGDTENLSSELHYYLQDDLGRTFGYSRWV